MLAFQRLVSVMLSASRSLFIFPLSVELHDIHARRSMYVAITGRRGRAGCRPVSSASFYNSVIGSSGGESDNLHACRRPRPYLLIRGDLNQKSAKKNSHGFSVKDSPRDFN